MKEYLLLGLTQGIFEWLPLSSEGMVILLANFLKLNLNFLDFALFLHLGTLFSVLIFFWRDWLFIIKNDKSFLRFLVIVSFVSLIVGFVFYHLIKDLKIGKIVFLLTGIGLLITAFFQKKTILNKLKKKIINEKTWPLMVGFFQGLAVIPGVSRSGMTIFALSLKEDSPYKILKISYLLSAPLIFFSSLYIFLEQRVFLNFNSLVSLFVSFLVGFFSLSFLLKLTQKINFSLFAFIFGILTILGALFI